MHYIHYKCTVRPEYARLFTQATLRSTPTLADSRLTLFVHNHSSDQCESLGLANQCWLMYAPRFQKTPMGNAKDGTNTESSTTSTPTPTATLALAPWIGGTVVVSGNTEVPLEPTGLRLALTSLHDSKAVEIDQVSKLTPSAANTLCVVWDKAPNLPTSLVANAMVSNYVIRTSLSVSEERVEEDSGEQSKQSEDFSGEDFSIDRSAFLEPRVCVCDGLFRGMKVSQDSDTPPGTVAVTVAVISENENGRSEAAELTFSVPRAALDAFEDSFTEKEEKTGKKSIVFPKSVNTLFAHTILTLFSYNLWRNKRLGLSEPAASRPPVPPPRPDRHAPRGRRDFYRLVPAAIFSGTAGKVL